MPEAEPCMEPNYETIGFLLYLMDVTRPDHAYFESTRAKIVETSTAIHCLAIQ